MMKQQKAYIIKLLWEDRILVYRDSNTIYIGRLPEYLCMILSPRRCQTMDEKKKKGKKKEEKKPE